VPNALKLTIIDWHKKALSWHN